jgi:predicted dehydrogenase
MLRLAQIGIGTWGQNLFRNFSALKECEMSVACDSSKKVLERIQGTHRGTVKTCADPHEVMRDNSIDAVIIATLPATHAALAIEALEAGKHVFVEKPMAMSVPEAKKMLEAARKADRILMVGHLLLYHPAVQTIKELVSAGTLGDLHYLYTTRVNLGQVREEENVLWSLTAHDISVSLYLLEKQPVRVQASGQSYLRKGIQDVVFVNIDFADGTLAHIHASWLDPHKMRKFTLVGSKKMVVFDDMESAEKLRIYDKGFDWSTQSGTYDSFLTIREGDISIPRVAMVEPLRLECQHFIDCITRGTTPRTDGRNGLAVLEVLNAAQRSLELDGAYVKIDS